MFRLVRRYDHIASLASGGMADVHLTLMRGPNDLSKLVVVKEIKKHLVANPELVRMFLAESHLTARLNHPNVVQTYEIGCDEHGHFLAMEYLDGISYWNLAWPRGDSRPPLALHLRVLADVLAGLHYVHELRDYDGSPLGLVHKDVSPQNVVVTYEGNVKIIDFGIANHVATESPKEGFRGKITYMAPEQARGLIVDRRADVFCVGIMLWEALTGERLWRGDRATLLQVLHDDIPDVRTVRPELPLELAAICARALAHRAANRFQTAAEMQDALERWVSRAGIVVTRSDVGDFVTARHSEERARTYRQIEAHVFANRTGQATPPSGDPRDATPAVVVRSLDAPAKRERLRPSAARRLARATLTIGVGALTGFLLWHTVGAEVTDRAAQWPAAQSAVASATSLAAESGLVPTLARSADADVLTTTRSELDVQSAMVSMRGRGEAAAQATPTPRSAISRRR